MHEEVLIGVTAVIGLGIAAQWFAWRLKLPAILLLLLAGFAAGPISGLVTVNGEPWLNPDGLFADVLFPVVSLSVAVILFEGGLTLKLGEFKVVGAAVRNLCSIGVVVTWAVCAVAARFVLGFDWPLSLLFGAMLTVTGPTVIGPLLRQVRPTGSTGTVLKWEGILVDPIGAVLAVLVVEAIVAGMHLDSVGHGEARHVAWEITNAIIFTILDGVVIGGVAAALLIVLMKRYWVPDFLQSPVTLVLVIVAFAASNHFREESGLLAVTVMGMVLANQKFAPVKHIIEFKENLRVLLISGLFILLSARLPLDTVKAIGWEHLAFLMIVIFIARPASVFLSTLGTNLTFKQRTLIGLIAPRGIIAAAIASVFAIKLGNEGYEGADQLVPAMFLVIVGTITFCGLCATPLARWLGQAADDPQGVLFVGAQGWVREMALALQREGFDTLLIDTNRHNTKAGRMAGLETKTGSILSEHLEEELDLGRFSKLIAMTGNDEANSLAAVQMIETFGREQIYQIAPHSKDPRRVKDHLQDQTHTLTGRFMVGHDFPFNAYADRFARGAEVKATKLTDEFNWADYQQHHGDRATPLFLITNAGKLRVFTANDSPKPSAGNTVIAIIDPTMGMVVGHGREGDVEAVVEGQAREDAKPNLPG